MKIPLQQAMRTISITCLLLISLIFIPYIYTPHIACAEEPPSPSPLDGEGKGSGELTPLERGIELLNEGRFDEALIEFSNAALQYPGDPQPHYFAALALQAKRELSRALAEIEKAAGMAPEVPLVHLRMGIILEQMGRLREAMNAYMQVLKTPEGESGEETPRIKEAKDRFRRLSVRVHFNAAKEFHRRKRYEDSLKELQELLAIEPNDYPSHYLMGIVLRDMGKMQEAIDALKKVVEINPNYADAYAQMGYLYERGSAFEDAEKSLERFLSLAPESPRAGEVRKGIERARRGTRLQKGFEGVGNLIKDERWDDALRENQALYEIQPDHPHVFYNFGVIYSYFKRYEDAIDNLRKALEREPKFFLAHQRLALVYDEMGRISEAIKEYKEAQANTTDEEEKKKIQGRIDILRSVVELPEIAKKVGEFLEKDDIEGAIREAEGLIAGRKKDTRLYLILGGLYMQKDRFNDAATTLEMAIDLDPKSLDARMLLSSVYERLGRMADAISSYRTAAALAGDTPTGRDAMERARLLEMRHHFQTAKGLKDGGDLEGALREIMAILEISPDNPVALFNAGVLNDLLDRHQKAESFLKRGIEISPGYVEAHLQLGLLLERERDFIGAEKAYSEVIRLQKEGDIYRLAKERLDSLKEVVEVSVRTKATLFLIDKNDFEGALREARAAISIYPENYMAYYYMGIIYDQTDKPEEAISALQRCIEIRPNFLLPYMLLGKIQVSQERLAEARETYRKVVDTGKGTREADMAAIQLKRLRPWRGDFSFSHSYNTNISYGIKARPNYSSFYGLNWDYMPWRTKKGGLNMGISGSENVYYNEQLSGYGYTLNIKGDYKYIEDNVFSLGLSQRRSYFEGKLTLDQYTLNIKGDYRYRRDKVFSLDLSRRRGQEPISRGFSLSMRLGIIPPSIPTSLSLEYLFSTNRTFPGKATDADRHTVSVNLREDIWLKNSVTAGYDFSVKRNNNTPGNNYGNRSHTISLGYNRILPYKVRGGLSYSIELAQYMNPDSTTFFQRFRRNIEQNIGVRLSLPLSEKVSFSLNYMYTENQTNLPRPTAELRQTLKEILSEPIPIVSGGYERHTATMSFGVSF